MLTVACKMRPCRSQLPLILLFLTSFIKTTICSHPDPQPPIGINLGPSYLTAAINTDHDSTRSLVKIEGDSYYKSFMRRNVWDEMSSSPQSVAVANLNADLSTLLKSTQKAPAAKKLLSIFKTLRTRTAKKLGHGVSYAVVGVPVYLSAESRKDVRTQLEAAGFKVLATIRQPALATTAFGYHSLEHQRREHCALNVDYNEASLDISILTTELGATDVLAHESYPQLGDDAMNLKIASLALDNEVSKAEHAPLKSLANQIHLHRKRNPSSKLRSKSLDASAFKNIRNANVSRLEDGGDAIETQHFSAIAAFLEKFMADHTYETHTGQQPWKPLLSDVSDILMAGDGSSRSFEGLRRTLAKSPTLSRLKDLGTDVGVAPAVEIASRGAAINGKGRMVKDAHYGDEEHKYIVHQEL